MRIKILAASLIILLAPAMATAAPVPSLMAPTGPWNVEFADSMCLLSRPYGENRAIGLLLKPNMIGTGLEIIVTKDTTAIGGPKSGKAVVTVAGNTVPDDLFFTAHSTGKARLIRIRLKDDVMGLSAVRETLAIDAKRESSYIFSIPEIGRALPVLSRCIDQLRAIYNISKVDLGAIATKPKGDFAFSFNDYPAEALRKGQSGTVGILFWVEVNGRVSTCHVIESAASDALERATCAIALRSRLEPAKDAAGKAVRAPSFTRISWTMP